MNAIHKRRLIPRQTTIRAEEYKAKLRNESAPNSFVSDEQAKAIQRWLDADEPDQDVTPLEVAALLATRKALLGELELAGRALIQTDDYEQREWANKALALAARVRKGDR